MASGNTNYNTNFNTIGHTTTTSVDKTSTLAHPYETPMTESKPMTGSTLGHMTGSTLGHMTGSTFGHTTGSTFGTTSGSTLGTTTAPSLSSTSTMGHTTTGYTTTGLKEGEHVSKGTGIKDEFVGGLKETAGTVFCSNKLKTEGHEQKILGKEEVAAAKAEKGIVSEKGTIGTAAGGRAMDDVEKEKMKGDKNIEKDQLKADKKAAKERAKAEKEAEKEHAKAEKISEKEHGKFKKGHEADKFEKGHKGDKFEKGETIKEPAHTEPFVGRVDRLNANYGNPHVEPHVAAMMTHGMPIETRTVVEQPVVTGVTVEKPLTTTSIVEKPVTGFEKRSEQPLSSYQKPLVGGAYEQKDIHEKTILDKPLASGFDKPLTGGFDKPLTGGFDKPLTGGFDKPLTGSFDKPLTGSFDKPLTGGFDKPLTGGFDKPLTGGFDKPLTGGFDKPAIVRETYTEEVIKPRQDLSSQPMMGSDKLGMGSDKLGTKFGDMNLNQGTRLNVSPRSDRLNVSPRNQSLNVSPRNLNVSPRKCDTARLETSPRHMASV